MQTTLFLFLILKVGSLFYIIIVRNNTVSLFYSRLFEQLAFVVGEYFNSLSDFRGIFRESTFPFIANFKIKESFFCLRLYCSVGRGSGDRACDDVSVRAAKCGVLQATSVEIWSFQPNLRSDPPALHWSSLSAFFNHCPQRHKHYTDHPNAVAHQMFLPRTRRSFRSLSGHGKDYLFHLHCSSLSSFSINREGLLRCLPVSSLVLNPFDTANDQQTAYKVDTWSVECRGILAGFLLPKTENALDEMPILSKGKALQSRRPFSSMPFSTITWRERISRTTLNSSWHTLFLQWLMR